MLGKVFEELVTRRHETGSYYTPRPIVTFMCREALKAFLSGKTAARTDNVAKLVDEHEIEGLNETHAREILEALDSLKAVDPACGSGAYLLGMLHELVSIYRLLYNERLLRDPRSLYDLKLRIISQNLYGVDVDRFATNIAMLRLWLSLAVEAEAPVPLPNLEFKIEIGNSLLGPNPREYDLLLQDIRPLADQAAALKREYFIAHGEDKNDFARQVEALEEAIRERLDAPRHTAIIDWRIQFPEVFSVSRRGFDIVLANPPYGADLTENEKDYLKNRFEYLVERIRNTYLYFLGLAYDISSVDGVICFIMPNEFLFQIYMTKARRFFLSNTQVLFAVNTGEDIFDAIVPTCVVALQRRRIPSYSIPVADLRDCTLPELREKLDIRKFSESSRETVGQTPNSAFSFDISRAALVSKLSTNFQRFDDFCIDVANGVCTSCDGVYIIEDAIANELQLEREHLKPTIRGGQFSRYCCPRSTQELVLYITSEFNPRQSPQIDLYLKRHKEQLIAGSVEKRRGTRNWRILFRGRYEGLFVHPKILIRQTADRIVAACDADTGYYCINSVNVAVLRPEYVKSINFFLGVLNSSLLNFFYREISQERGRVLAEVKPQRIRCLPISFGDNESNRKISALVDEIVRVKHATRNSDTSQLEAAIDAIIYKMYGLTADEIELVKGSV